MSGKSTRGKSPWSASEHDTSTTRAEKCGYAAAGAAK
jgi:hypothetical protein